MKTRSLISVVIILCIFGCVSNGYATTELTEAQIKAFSSVKIVRIVVDQVFWADLPGGEWATSSLPEALLNITAQKLDCISLPFEDVLRRLFRYARVKAVNANAKYYDATLKIAAMGLAFEHKYQTVQLNCFISLKMLDVPEYKSGSACRTYPFYGSITTGTYNDACAAPFKKAFRESGSFLSVILKMIGELRGPVPLIAALKDKDSDLRRFAAKALVEITGQDFGEDLVKWQKWWEENKETYLKGR